MELLALLRDVDPKTAFTTNGACTLNGKTNDVGRIDRGREIDVAARDIRMTSIIQWKVVNFLGGWWTDGTHDEV